MKIISDIASCHDGNLERAKLLIRESARAGANYAKFQHFLADTIISKVGFDIIGKQSHQTAWNDTVYETYKKYELPLWWLPELKAECKEYGIELLITPYDIDSIPEINEYVDMYKVGSGDIDNYRLFDALYETGKPILIATGASDQETISNTSRYLYENKINCIGLMHCNTNYEGNNEQYINLHVLINSLYVGYSSHTKGYLDTVVAAGYGIDYIEKHITDGKSASPDNGFALTIAEFKLMVDKIRIAETMRGDGIKRVEENEIGTSVIQRRGVYAKTDIVTGDILTDENTIAKRPAIPGILTPDKITGKVRKDIKKDQPIMWQDVEV